MLQHDAMAASPIEMSPITPPNMTITTESEQEIPPITTHVVNDPPVLSSRRAHRYLSTPTLHIDNISLLVLFLVVVGLLILQSLVLITVYYLYS